MLAVSTTAAAYIDRASVNFTVSGLYDIAYLDGHGAVQQGNPTVYVIDSTGLGPITKTGAATTHTLDLMVKNVGTTDAGMVEMRVASLLPAQPADADGVVRDPFDVLVMTVKVDGTTVLAEVDAKNIVIPLTDWAPGQVKTIEISTWRKADLGTPFYNGKDVKLGFSMTGVAR